MPASELRSVIARAWQPSWAARLANSSACDAPSRNEKFVLHHSSAYFTGFSWPLAALIKAPVQKPAPVVQPLKDPPACPLAGFHHEVIALDIGAAPPTRLDSLGALTTNHCLIQSRAMETLHHSAGHDRDDLNGNRTWKHPQRTMGEHRRILGVRKRGRESFPILIAFQGRYETAGQLRLRLGSEARRG